MKILHVIIGLGVGGAENSLRKLVEASSADGIFQHSVISLTTVGAIGEALQSRGIRVQALGMQSLRDVPRILARLRAILRQERPDVVQTWMYHADFIGGLAARAAGCSAVIWGVRSTDMIIGTGRATMAIRRACAVLSRQVPRAIVCASHSARRTHEAVGYDSARMMVIPNGYDTARLQGTEHERRGIRDEGGFADTTVVVGCVGRFNHYKDHANFVGAAGVLAQRFPNVKFLLVGEGIDQTNTELMRWINLTGFRERFVLLGMRSDIVACYSAMDIACLPSRSEAFPNVVGEAMAAGVPNVVTDVGDAALLVGDTGVVVPRENSSALAAGLAQLIEMSAEGRRALGQRAQRRIETEFSMEHSQRLFESLYASITHAQTAKTTA